MTSPTPKPAPTPATLLPEAALEDILEELHRRYVGVAILVTGAVRGEPTKEEVDCRYAGGYARALGMIGWWKQNEAVRTIVNCVPKPKEEDED